MIDLALYHFHVTQIKRSKGGSVIASAVYRAGEKLHSERYDEYSDYTRKGGVIMSEILLSPQAPREYADRETLWNAVEKAEKRPDAQLAYHVAMGVPLWDYPVRQGTVLYLALEDDYPRLQGPLMQMFRVESTDNLVLTTQSKTLAEGLTEQMERFMQRHPDTSLVIVDTLQKVREIGNESYSYAMDYTTISQL